MSGKELPITEEKFNLPCPSMSLFSYFVYYSIKNILITGFADFDSFFDPEYILLIIQLKITFQPHAFIAAL